MKYSLICLITCLTLSQATVGEEPSVPAGDLPDGGRELSREELESIYRELDEQDRGLQSRGRGFVVVPPGSAGDEDPPKFSGEWKEVDGARVCDGYLTRISDDEFCSAEIPADWRRFEFDGKTFYIAPTSD